jgi:CRP-like cAMP-binding protein
MPSRRALHAEANRLLHAGEGRAALRHLIALVRSSPHDLEARLRAADALHAAGQVREAVDAWSAVLVHAVGSGYPLLGVVAVRRLAAVDAAAVQLFDAIADRYASDARRAGPGARMSPPDGDAEVPSEAYVPRAWSEDEVVAGARGLLVGREGLPPRPEVVPPVPLLSALPREAFARFVRACAVRHAPVGSVVLREGDPASSFFLVARGRVEVTQGARRLAALGEGSVFGEMALLSHAPRNATVTVTEDADLLEFGAQSLRAASTEVPIIASVLDRFMQQRLLAHALASHPFFSLFDPDQRHAVAARFSPLTLAPGDALVREGSSETGLVLILSGEVDVTRARDGATVHLANLGPGDLVGEIGVVGRVPATATVTARSPVRALALPRAFAERLVDGVGALRGWLSELADQRALDTQLTLAAPDEGPLT